MRKRWRKSKEKEELLGNKRGKGIGDRKGIKSDKKMLVEDERKGRTKKMIDEEMELEEMGRE